LTLDRIDVNGNYSPENCKWSTTKEQGRNMRTNLRLEYNGEILCAAEIAERNDIPLGRFYYRIHHGLSVLDAINIPLGKNFNKKCNTKNTNYKLPV
jgi:hypothetical protein